MRRTCKSSESLIAVTGLSGILSIHLYRNLTDHGVECRTVPVGTQIEYKGTDYLRIDLSTRLIYNVTSSSDLLNYYTQLGDNVIAGK